MSQKAELEKQRGAVIKMITDLNKADYETSDERCVWDIEANRVRDFAETYQRRCKKMAASITMPPLCYQHAKKRLQQLLTQIEMGIKKEDNIPVSRALANKAYNLYNPYTILANTDEYLQVKNDTAISCTNPADGLVYDRYMAICAAYHKL